ncbi:hypothetical protein BS78_10G008200 [Paspalum vaginatum]|nr:hypothetical protein BS78_10G008200 [Paspalum vaginatum]
MLRLHRCPGLPPPLPQPAACRRLAIASAPELRSPIAFPFSGARARDPPWRVAVSGAARGGEERRRWGHVGDDDGEDLGEALARTRQLVECAMFAAVAGLAYFLSNSLAIENYFSCFFPLPIVISSLRWGLEAGRKTMVATVLLLFTLSGPVKASTYLLMHGVVGLVMGTVWRLETNWIVSIILCSIIRALGACGYVLVSSFLIRENILALITVNIHASLTYILTAAGVNMIPSMDAIYVLFGTLLLLNCGFFVFLLHISPSPHSSLSLSATPGQQLPLPRRYQSSPATTTPPGEGKRLSKMPRASSDARLLIQSLSNAYAATPTNLKIIDLYVVFAVATALVQVAYMGLVGSFPFNSFLSGVLSCIGTAVLAVCLRIQVNKDNKEFKDLPPERAFADFVLCNLVLHLVIMNFLG